MPAFKQAKYTREKSAEIKLTALRVLQDAGRPLTISEICASDMSLTYQTTQKMARELAELVEAGLTNGKELVKVLGNGELKAKVDVEANAFSKSAEEAIKAVGGNATII